MNKIDKRVKHLKIFNNRVTKLKLGNRATSFTPWIIVGVVFIVLLTFIGFSKGVFADKHITSGTKITNGCTPEDIPISIKGTVYTRDKAWFGVIVEPDKVSIDSVTVGGISLRAVSTQEFTWTVKLYDDFTGNLVTQDAGTNSHPGGDVLTEDKFALNFFIADNDCNEKIDNFEGNLVFEVRTDDGETKAISQKLSFVQGKLVR